MITQDFWMPVFTGMTAQQCTTNSRVQKINEVTKNSRYRLIGSTNQSDFIGADIARRFAVFRPDFDPFAYGTHNRYFGSLTDLRHGAG